MNNKDLFYAFASIDENYINKAQEVPEIKKKVPFVALPKQVHLITGLICAFIAVIIVCALFSNRGTLPLTVTGYSISPDGCPIASEMTLKHDVPVSVFESNTEPEEYAFAFSYPNITDDTECQDIFVYSSYYIPNSNLESVDYDYLKNFSLPKDENSRQKFYESYKDYSLEEFEAFLRKDMSDLGY